MRPLLIGAVMTAGPAGWRVLGAAVAGLSVAQRRACLRRLGSMLPAADSDVPSGTVPARARPDGRDAAAPAGAKAARIAIADEIPERTARA
ncbi:hypothetical protein ACQPYK_03150 [Streptosporangium sp. CA-135522]|uniref:hypothetical protein n=1 Tax=Streptosporangium sp. CA-135522 TaxID=3240072 RepID=UPI003D8D9EE3